MLPDNVQACWPEIGHNARIANIDRHLVYVLTLALADDSGSISACAVSASCRQRFCPVGHFLAGLWRACSSSATAPRVLDPLPAAGFRRSCSERTSEWYRHPPLYVEHVPLLPRKRSRGQPRGVSSLDLDFHKAESAPIQVGGQLRKPLRYQNRIQTLPNPKYVDIGLQRARVNRNRVES